MQAFAQETSPAGRRQYVEALRRYGIRATQADAREAAVCALRSDLMALGYTEGEIRWHAARRGRRVKCLYVAGATIPQ